MKKESYHILVTGCGGDIGQSIGKILREHPLCSRLVGCDIHDEHAGIFIFESFEKVVRVDDPAYVDQMNALIAKYAIDILIPTAEPELRFFVKNGLHRKLEVVQLIMPNDYAMSIGFDKFATAAFLEKEGLPYPATHLISEKKATGFPCIVKSRRGAGSKNVLVVRDQEELDFYAKK